ncbi:MAG: SRPBCC family protein [Ktedonobacterales bacterium]
MIQHMNSDQESGGRSVKTIHHVFEIAAPRETVFNALTTAAGLSSWWTTSARADEAAVGALLDVTFGRFNPHLRITELDPHTHLVWEGVGGYQAWGGTTTIRFELEATSGGTLVRFWQRLGPELGDDAVGTANFNWGYYLDSLRLLCETGTGKPFQNEVAGARAGASGIR